MPFVFDPLDEENQQQPGEKPQMTGGGLSFGGAAGAPMVKDSSPKGVNKQGSGFVGLDQYMAANKGNKFGSQFTGKVTDTIGQAETDLNQSAQDFTNASNQGTTKWDDVGNRYKRIINNAGDNTTAREKSVAKQFQNVSYQGPESFSGTAYADKAMGGVQKASQQARALQSEGGRFALLDQYFGRPTYSMGQKTLDNMLVRNSGAAAKAKGIGQQAQALGQQAKQTAQGLESLVNTNRAATQNTAQQAKGYADKALANFGTDLQGRYDQFNADNKAYNDRIARVVKGLRSGTTPSSYLSGKDLKNVDSILGLSPNQSLYGIKDLSKYLQSAPAQQLSNFASDQDYARYLALADLAGEDPALLSAENRDQAGTANGYVTGKKDILARDIAARKTEYENKMKNEGPYAGTPNDGVSWNTFIENLTGHGRLPANDAYVKGKIEELNAIRAAYGQDPIDPNIISGGSDIAPSPVRPPATPGTPTPIPPNVKPQLPPGANDAERAPDPVPLPTPAPKPTPAPAPKATPKPAPKPAPKAAPAPAPKPPIQIPPRLNAQQIAAWADSMRKLGLL